MTVAALLVLVLVLAACADDRRGSRAPAARTILAPTMVVVARTVDDDLALAGTVVAAGEGRLDLVLAVPERDVGGVPAGRPVEFTVAAYPERRFHAVVRRVGDPSPGRRAFTAAAEIVAADGLVPGMAAEARLTRARVPRPVVPLYALRVTGGPTRLYAVVDGRAVERVVELGHQVDGGHIVLRGVAAGETIVAPLDDSIVDGALLAEPSML